MDAIDRITELEKGDKTSAVYEAFYWGEIFDREEFNFEELQNAVDFNEKSSFLEGVAQWFQQHGVECSETDPEFLLSQVKKCYKEKIGEACPKTIVKWFRGATPSVENRMNNYNLCYALGMDLYETATFFKKYFFALPFNYKDSTDAVFLYCLHRKRPYDVIKSMLITAESFAHRNDHNTQTMDIGRNILQIDNDDEFLRYLSLHCFNEEQQHQTARQEIVELIDKHNDNHFQKLHEEIMGIPYQTYNKKLNPRIKDGLPIEFTRSLPTYQTFSKIKKGEVQTSETLRKALIIMRFYDYYDAAEKANPEPDDEIVKENLDDFAGEMDELLIKCGFSQLYERNPFDKLMLFCASSRYPLQTFHALNDLRYKNPDEE